jgi:hypothetical protein
MDGNGDGVSSHRRHPSFASFCVVVATIDGTSIIVTLIVVMQYKHFPPWVYNSCYYSYCVSNDNNTKRERERGVKRREGESEKEKN